MRWHILAPTEATATEWMGACENFIPSTMPQSLPIARNDALGEENL